MQEHNSRFHFITMLAPRATPASPCFVAVSQQCVSWQGRWVHRFVECVLGGGRS